MALHRIVSGGAPQGGRQQTCVPVFRSQGRERPSKVWSHLTELYRAIDWDYVRLVVGYSVAVFVVVYVAAGRMR